MEKFYITTAIAYASRKPHFGNTYEIIMADAFARFQRRMGKDVFLCTGTDEHGQKIEDLAKAAGVSPKAYVDGVADTIRGIWDLMGSSHDHFIRTTDSYHESAVAKIFKKFYDKGDIYKACASEKGTVSETRRTARDHDACEICTRFERAVSDACDAVRKVNVFQRRAILKGACSDADCAFGDFYAF